MKHLICRPDLLHGSSYEQLIYALCYLRADAQLLYPMFLASSAVYVLEVDADQSPDAAVASVDSVLFQLRSSCSVEYFVLVVVAVHGALSVSHRVTAEALAARLSPAFPEVRTVAVVNLGSGEGGPALLLHAVSRPLLCRPLPLYANAFLFRLTSFAKKTGSNEKSHGDSCAFEPCWKASGSFRALPP